MIKLIVYADVLIFLNTLVDYFLLLATSQFTGEKVKAVRIVLAALLGGLSCVYIFLPNVSVILELTYKICVALLLTAVCFKFKGIKQYFKNVTIFFVMTCAYAGIMFALWLIFKPYGMVINNSVVYFNISPIILVVCSAGGYILFSILWHIFSKSSKFCDKCDITVYCNNKSITLKAIADTGNSIEDIFDTGEVIIADKTEVEQLLNITANSDNPNLKRRYRVLPCSTVTGYNMLEGYRTDKAIINYEGRLIPLKTPLLAISKVKLNDDYNAIINPKILR